jgi:hypothetical protein
VTNIQIGQKFLYKNNLFEIKEITFDIIKAIDNNKNQEMILKFKDFIQNLNKDFILQ